MLQNPFQLLSKTLCFSSCLFKATPPDKPSLLWLVNWPTLFRFSLVTQPLFFFYQQAGTLGLFFLGGEGVLEIGSGGGCSTIQHGSRLES